MTKAKWIHVLITLSIIFAGWAGTSVVINAKNISSLDERTKTTREMLGEIYKHLLGGPYVRKDNKK